jgi:cyanophycin synthetase
MQITGAHLRRIIREELARDQEPLKIISVSHLPAPNKWGDRDLIHMLVDLGPLEELPTGKIPGFPQRLLRALPTLDDHRCSYGERGGLTRRMTEDEGTWMGHVLEHVAIELQCLQGDEVGFGRTRGAGPHGQYNVWFECLDPEAGIAAGHAARRLLLQIIDDLGGLPG